MAAFGFGAVLLMAVAGGVGALVRWGVDTWLKRRMPALASLTIINVLGSFLLGITMAGLGQGAVSLAIGTGFLGGFTTFSTVAVGLVNDVLAPAAPAASTGARAGSGGSAARQPAACRYGLAAVIAVGMLGVAVAAFGLGFALAS